MKSSSKLFKFNIFYFSVCALVSSYAWAQSDITTDNIDVFGSGQTRDVENINNKQLSKLPPGSSPFEALAQLPGVNFQSADTFGAYEWSTSLTIRGFNQNQLGFTLDDVPLGDMSYSNWNGLHISRAISTENIGNVTLSQGTGAIDTASNSNLGGTIQFYSLDPLDKRTTQFDQTIGQYSDSRTFVRFDSGRFDNGAKFDVSYVNQDSEKWRGYGHQLNEQYNSKFVDIFGENKLSAFFNYSNRHEIDYQDMSKTLTSTNGYNWDNTYPNYSQALSYATPNCNTNYSSQCDNAYYAGSGLRKDWLSGITLDAKVSDNMRWKNTLYYHRDHGAGLWFTPYVASPSGSPISLRTTEYDIHRSGLVSSLTYDYGIHKIEGGLWYEDNTFDQARRFYGLGLTDPGRSPYDIPSNPFATQWQYEFHIKSTVLHIQDTVQVNKALTLNAGVKASYEDITSNTVVGSTFGEIKAEKPLLPQIGFNYKLNNNNEFFGSVAQNMRAYEAAATGVSPYATTSAGFSAITGTLKPETSVTYETGWRYKQHDLQTLLTIYHVDFKDRLIGTQVGAGIVGNPTILSNVGGVTTNGAEASVSWAPVKNYNWLNSISFNDSTYSDNVVSNGMVYAISGKTVVDSPKEMFRSELDYDDGLRFGRLTANYTGKRYYTYTNDNSVDSYWIMNMSAGYRFKNPGIVELKEIDLQVSVNNLLNKQYFSTIGTNGFVYNDPTGSFQTLQEGAPRTGFVTLTGKF
ncbi:MAG: hypothetical protein B7Z60_05910 [Ferrovum sp. 37-45-19]|nr:MAG: hypothetical protein B7Z65_06065 [Ferrovum sp. 21-44-67]OYV94261.1 MAG: hypothetical protein B7Z60_05910 [Ferrovum sp. 37-45-19]HQT81734.1 TonB-dependent receptor [Ferrovaceae bacterium]HQU07036.1 TonB-dependent receptor [Ferrovaceae bacterium]